MVYSGKMPGEMPCVPLPLWRMGCSFLLDGFQLVVFLVFWFVGLLVCWLIFAVAGFRPAGDQLIQLDRSRSQTCTEPAAPLIPPGNQLIQLD